MIIDALKDTKTSISVSYYDTASDKITSGSLSFLGNDPLVWSIENQHITTANMVIDFAYPLVFNDMQYSFALNTAIKCYHSRDGYTWEEFKYFNYTISTQFPDGDPDTAIINRYAGSVLKVEFINQSNVKRSYYSIVDPTSQIVTAIPASDYQTLKKYLDVWFMKTNLVSTGKISPAYVFTVTDPITGLATSVYHNLLISHIKIVLGKFHIMDTPQKLNSLKILASVDINIDDGDNTYPSTFIGKLFQQKYFEEYQFEPSMVATFFDMLESTSPQYAADNNKRVDDVSIAVELVNNAISLSLNVADAPVPLILNPVTGKMVLPDLCSLGMYFNPIFAVTITPAKGMPTKYVYASTQVRSDPLYSTLSANTWDEINTHLNVLLSSQLNIVIEFSLITTQYKLSNTVAYTYTTNGWTTT